MEAMKKSSESAYKEGDTVYIAFDDQEFEDGFPSVEPNKIYELKLGEKGNSKYFHNIDYSTYVYKTKLDGKDLVLVAFCNGDVVVSGKVCTTDNTFDDDYLSASCTISSEKRPLYSLLQTKFTKETKKIADKIDKLRKQIEDLEKRKADLTATWSKNI